MRRTAGRCCIGCAGAGAVPTEGVRTLIHELSDLRQRIQFGEPLKQSGLTDADRRQVRKLGEVESPRHVKLRQRRDVRRNDLDHIFD